VLGDRKGLQEGWSSFLSRFGFDCFFTLTFRNPAWSAECAVDRACRLLRKFFKHRHMKLDAFVVAEQHLNGCYHVHGMLRLGALSDDQGVQLLRGLWTLGFNTYGRCQFDLIRSSESVRLYISKYLTKRVADYRLLGLK
jgi:hypothetical protein